MTAEFTLHFKTVDEFLHLLKLLKENGIKDFTFNPRFQQKKKTGHSQKNWAFGIGDLGGKLDHINIRDYAYED